MRCPRCINLRGQVWRQVIKGLEMGARDDLHVPLADGAVVGEDGQSLGAMRDRRLRAALRDVTKDAVHKSALHKKKKPRSVARLGRDIEGSAYLILPSLYSTCLRATGSYFRTTIFSVMVRAFFLVT